jgi:hypothetical protein
VVDRIFERPQRPTPERPGRRDQNRRASDQSFDFGPP